VPAWNEEEALPSTLENLREKAPDLDVVVVDDGSDDATSRAARSAGARVVRLSFNLGVGGAVKTGLHFAVDHGYDRVVVFDADGQHDSATTAALLAALDAGADMAIGSRFAPGAPDYVVGVTRRRAMALLRFIVRRATGQSFTDVTSGFRAFGRPVLDLLAREYPAEYLADTVEVLLIVSHAGYRIDEVPATMRPRAGGRPSSGRLRLALNYLRLIVGILSSAYRRSRPRAEETQ